MKKLLTALLTISLIFGMTGLAAAFNTPSCPTCEDGVWTEWQDVYDPEDVKFNKNFKYLSFQHDITDDGFTVDEDYVTTYSLSMSLWDDDDRKLEYAKIDLPGISTDRVYEIDYFDITRGWSIAGLVQLNLLGTLDVSIKRLSGDFWFGDSTLTARGCDNAPVPEPGTIILLGFGLLGMVTFGRKKIARK